jgi:hypothetical protein
MGDFNEILFQHEKQGGTARPQQCMDMFREAHEDCDLEDLGYTCDLFTWWNHHHNADCYIRERLDRAVANTEWRNLFPGYEVRHGDQQHSDHMPIIVKLDGENTSHIVGQNKHTFRFEAQWLNEEGCAELVEKAWAESFGAGSQTVGEGLQDVSKVLDNWNRNVLGDLDTGIKKVKKKLQQCVKKPLSNTNIQEEHVMRYHLDKLEGQKNTYWKQRAHVEWMKNGDRNTRFFHACATQRRRSNRINHLKREDGTWVEDSDLQSYIAQQYKELFQTQGGHHL